MKHARFIFCGNRHFAFQALTESGVEFSKIFAIAGSYFARYVKDAGLSHELVADRASLVAALELQTFDYVVSNGCPFILPISRLAAGGGRRFVNIHPSLLPDLRGADPVPGALLHGRRSGASCHLMDDGIDTGPVIAQVEIDGVDGCDAALLYQLSFLAEQQVAHDALARGFRPLDPQPVSPVPPIYYTRKADDLRLDLGADAVAMRHRIRAFSNRSQGAFFEHGGQRVVVRDAEIVDSRFLQAHTAGARENEVILNYEGSLLVRKGDLFLKFKDITGDIAPLRPGVVLGSAPPI